jgi:hypothetical protein
MLPIDQTAWAVVLRCTASGQAAVAVPALATRSRVNFRTSSTCFRCRACSAITYIRSHQDLTSGLSDLNQFILYEQYLAYSLRLTGQIVGRLSQCCLRGKLISSALLALFAPGYLPSMLQSCASDHVFPSLQQFFLSQNVSLVPPRGPHISSSLPFLVL